uniref:Uncharacterized protein n=1 Tax=viral metagenome TaxID=1070528 RepID=A0A6C0ID84_9ZZZZ
MGQSSSTTSSSSSAPTQWTTEQVQQATGMQNITAKDTDALNMLSPSQKKQFLHTIHQQQKMSDSAIKEILQQAKAQAKQQQAKLQKVKIPTQELTQKQKTTLQALPCQKAVKAKTKIAKVLAKQTKAKKAVIKKEIKKEKTVCATWKANKKAEPAHPKNPLSNRKVSAGKRTFKIVDEVCKNKKKACAKPTTSPATGKPLKDTSKEATMLRELCAAKKLKATKAKATKAKTTQAKM